MKTEKSKYTPSIETSIAQDWISRKTFKSEIDLTKKSYTILLPPPNITGELHIGHCLNMTLQDILIRKHRQIGYNTCWIPGLDHASIATEAKIINMLKEKGIKKENLTKKEFLDYCYKWYEEYKEKINSLIKRMGFALDWDRFIFTMGEQHSKITQECYEKLNKDGLIYKANKKMNYDPYLKTFISNIEAYEENGIKYSERSGAKIIEIESEQIFLKMESISKPAKEDIIKKIIRIIPENQLKNYLHWFENIEDWCISRNLIWGHEIPNTDFTMDTWFSSWHWSHSPFKSKEEFDYYCPSNIIITGYDISFFWIARMIMSSHYFKNQIPFKNIYFTGLIRDKHGRKISKQFGNSPDLIKLIDKYGADSLRFSCIINHNAGLDSKWDISLIEQGYKLCNKIWNANRLFDFWMADEKNEITEKQNIALSEIKEKFEKIKLSHNKLLLEEFKFSESLKEIYSFFWEDFCSKFLENIKPTKENFPIINKELYDEARKMFLDILELFEPFMPFITNKIKKTL